MNSEALQNPYFVRLFCIWILTKHIYNYIQNRSFDKIKIVWAFKFQKKGGGTTLKGGGGDPLFPLNPPLPSSSTKGGMHVNAPGEYTRKISIISYSSMWMWSRAERVIIFSHIYFYRHFVVYNWRILFRIYKHVFDIYKPFANLNTFFGCKLF